MKGRRVRSFTRPSTTTKRDEALYRYLKPGALAKLRDSKIVARSQRFDDLESQISLFLSNLPAAATTTSSSSASSPSQNAAPNQPDEGFPCFALRINRPRCLQRKKLVAVTPVFSECEPPS